MKLISLFYLVLYIVSLSFPSCKSRKDVPDVSNIKISVRLIRFDKSFFSLDTQNLRTSLISLRSAHPEFYDDYMKNILGVTGSTEDSATLQTVKIFLRDYRPVFDSLMLRYRNTEWLQKDLTGAFRYLKYYFPDYPVGNIFLYVGPFTAPGIAVTHKGLAIGLQQFAGSSFSLYQEPWFVELYPQYISRRFSPEYITAGCMKAVIEDLFPDQSAGKPLIEQMIEKGKRWWLLDKLMPYAHDSVKTGFTQLQLTWCARNEGLIWADIVRTTDLNSIEPSVVKNYIGEAPFTVGLNQDYSPGNIGQWIGRQIVRKYAEKHPGLTVSELMNVPPRKILEEAKYKPR
ncbi:MAG: hypothetical protein N2747_02590 [Chitinophagaceae bacterium]|nr:hypothetical protein [Chitinophagaceae bacterium]